jgi:glycine/D-amino acid oxidase-like deaminating enzyme
VPAFEEIKVKASWSGLYEYSTLDQNAFMGRMPQVDNLLICNGFSGHGLQQSPAAGRAMAELVVDGRYTTLDLSIFGMQRLLTSPPTPVLERNIV